MVSGRRVASSIRSLVNAKSLRLEYNRVLDEKFLVPVLTYGDEKIIWREKEKSTIRVVQMDNLRGLLSIRRMDKVPNARMRQLCGVMKGVNQGFPTFLHSQPLT